MKREYYNRDTEKTREILKEKIKKIMSLIELKKNRLNNINRKLNSMLDRLECKPEIDIKNFNTKILENEKLLNNL